MRWTVTWLACLTLLASCASGGAGIDPCGPWRPILVSRSDALTEGTARQILAHNEAGARLCGW
jgi:hypothetical protein